MREPWKTHTAIRGYEVSPEGEIRRNEEGIFCGVPEPVFSSCLEKRERCAWIKPIGAAAALILRIEGLKNFNKDES